MGTETVQTMGRNLKLFGVMTVIFGVLAILSPGMVGISVPFVVGLLVLLGGLARMIWAFGAASFGRGLVTFALGVLTALCGVVLLAHPLFALGLLTILLAVYFVVDGLAEVFAALRIRPAPGSGWLLLGGFVSILLGILIWRQFPFSSLWAIGVLLGVKLIMVGTLMLKVGSVVRAAASS